MTGGPYLSGAFEPLRVEGERPSLRLEGELPAGLAGTYYRIGPNPQFPPRGVYNPLSGDGMVHAFTIGEGRVSWRNRWVRTEQWRRDHAAGRALFGPSGVATDRDESVLGLATDGVANTAMVLHAGKLLTLEEGHAPIAIDADSLETEGPWTFGGRLPRNMTAHPKVDAVTGEMLAFANFPSGRPTGQVGLYTIGPDGALVDARVVEGPFPALIHDFAITERFIIVPFCPVTVSGRRAMAGGPAIAWEPDLGLQVALVPRRGDVADTRWFSGPAAMAWHTVNAFEDGDRVIVDVCQQDAAVFPRADGAPTDPAATVQRLARWTLDPGAKGPLGAEVRNSVPCEYPRIDERFTGRAARFTWLAACGGPGTGDAVHRGVASFDQVSGDIALWHGGSSAAVGEPVFAPRPGSTEEGDGWLLTVIHDEGLRTSHLAVFDARDVAAGPIVRAHTDLRIPMGFHGLWRSP